ncbi:AI-2E family transporter [Candidatus Amarolinea dominans]|uniref:AI-2E family transporter n=1 Tax=Candidatus Amarolinea dominans TaxID=3140696 RepID=UPI003134B2A6|nr:AI-2E family transporter [Anaerolineae bacterium]
MPDHHRPTELLPRSLIIVLTLAVSIYLIEKLTTFVSSFSGLILMVALAWLLSFALQPLVTWLQRRKLSLRRVRGLLPRQLAARLPETSQLPFALAVAVVYGVLVAGLTLALLALAPVLVHQLDQLARSMQTQAGNLPQWLQQATDWLNEMRTLLITRLDIDPNLIVLPQPADLLNQVPLVGANLLQFGLGLAGGIATAFSQFLIIIFLSLFVTLDGGAIAGAILSVLPKRYEDEYQMAAETIDRTFGGFLRGTVLQGLIFGIAVSLLMFLLRIDSALVVGVATGLVVLVPIVGGIVATILPVLVAALQGSPNTLWLLLALLVFQVILFNVVMPSIFSGSLRMPSLLIVISLMVGSQLMGFWGFVFGVPLAAAAYSITLVLLEQAKRRQDVLDEAGARPSVQQDLEEEE